MIKKTIPVSVVIPCWRGHLTVRRAVGSVMDGTVLPEEIIIIEDCSNDGDITWNKLLEIKEEFGAVIQLIRHDINVVLGTTRNDGWEKAKGKYLAFLDDDDIWHPEKLEIQYRFMEENPEADILGCRVKWLREGRNIALDKLEFRKIHKVEFLARNPYFTSSVILRKSINIRFPLIRRVEDYYLWLSLRNNHNFYLCKNYLCYMLKPPFGVRGLGSNIKIMHKANMEVFKDLKDKKFISLPEYIIIASIEKLKFPLRKVKGVLYNKLFELNKLKH